MDTWGEQNTKTEGSWAVSPRSRLVGGLLCPGSLVEVRNLRVSREQGFDMSIVPGKTFFQSLVANLEPLHTHLLSAKRNWRNLEVKFLN